MQRDHAEPVVQVFAECPGGNGLLKVFVRCGDDPHIHLDGPRAAHALEGLLLKDAEDLGLRLQAHVPDCLLYTSSDVRSGGFLCVGWHGELWKREHAEANLRFGGRHSQKSFSIL